MDEDENLYDEFGNYVGPEASDDGSDGIEDRGRGDDTDMQVEEEFVESEEPGK